VICRGRTTFLSLLPSLPIDYGARLLSATGFVREERKWPSLNEIVFYPSWKGIEFGRMFLIKKCVERESGTRVSRADAVKLDVPSPQLLISIMKHGRELPILVIFCSTQDGLNRCTERVRHAVVFSEHGASHTTKRFWRFLVVWVEPRLQVFLFSKRPLCTIRFDYHDK
jgi:hypothetical protein